MVQKTRQALISQAVPLIAVFIIALFGYLALILNSSEQWTVLGSWFLASSQSQSRLDLAG